MSTLEAVFPCSYPLDTLFGYRFAAVAKKSGKTGNARIWPKKSAKTGKLFRNLWRTIAITARIATSNLEVVRVRIEKLIDLMLFNRALHSRLVDVVDLNANRVRLLRRFTLCWEDTRRESSGTHIWREIIDAIFEHVSPR